MEGLKMNVSGKIIVKGKQKASGTISISGSKNSVLPIMAASLLTEDSIILKNVPNLADVNTMIEILESAGKIVKRKDSDLIIDDLGIFNSEIPYEPVRKMRASFNVYGPLTMRNKKAKVALPGGCSLGARPVNYHLEGLKKLGIESVVEHGFVLGTLGNTKDQIHITLPFPSVGATEHIITTAALLNKKEITISNCAIEPEITDLIDFLNKMGAKIEGRNSSVVKIIGVEKLKGVEYSVIPDRIEAGTYAIMGALIGDNLTLKNINEEHLQSILATFEDIGIDYSINSQNKSLTISAGNFKDFKNVDIETSPYPGFATDLQPQISVLLSLVPGRSTITEKIFHSRFTHIDELNRMGAKIKIEDSTAIIEGVNKLSAAPVQASNLRDSAALLIAAFLSDGETIITEVDHIFRGYEKLQEKLNNVGLYFEYEN